MRGYWFLELMVLGLWTLIIGCQSTSTPTAAPAMMPPSPPTGEATATTEPTLAPTLTSLEPTDMPIEPTRSSDIGAGNADVLFVRAIQSADGTWTFHVTVEHPDAGWEDYADGWDAVTPDGEVLKPDPDSPFTRLLLHPHENEQPFTRSQSGIVVPDGVAQVRVRAHDLVDGYGGREVMVDLTESSGLDFEVER
jgi:hypothetical protein